MLYPRRWAREDETHGQVDTGADNRVQAFASHAVARAAAVFLRLRLLGPATGCFTSWRAPHPTVPTRSWRWGRNTPCSPYHAHFPEISKATRLIRTHNPQPAPRTLTPHPLTPHSTPCHPTPQIRDTLDLDAARRSYHTSLFPLNPGGLVPAGPTTADLQLDRPAGRGPSSALEDMAYDRRVTRGKGATAGVGTT